MMNFNKSILASVIAVIVSQGFVSPVNAQSEPVSAAQEAQEQEAQEQETQEQEAVSPASQADQTTSKDPVRLQSVSVRARRVEEQSQEVPVAVTAVTAETIENKGLEGIEDVARFAPGLTFHGFYGRANDRPIVRGQVSVLGEANSSFFIDGVFVDGSISGYDLSNVQQVEVIRGPQSALFGRRTFSGAINYITKVPTGKPEGGATIQFGNYGQQQVKLNYSGPISETVSFAVNAYSDKNDGLFYNTYSDRKDLGGRKTESLGGTLYWLPNSAFSATLRLNYQNHSDQFAAQHPIGFANSNCNGTFTGEYLDDGTPIYTGRPGVCGEVKIPRDGAFALSTTDFELAGRKAGLEGTGKRASLSLNYGFENYWDLTSTTSYNRRSNYRAQDQDYRAVRGGGGLYETYGKSTSHDFSQEFRLATDESLPLRGQVGVYYYKEGNGHGYVGDLSGFNLSPGAPGNSTTPVPASVTYPSAEVENRSIFGMVEYQINEKWKASAEVRRGEDIITANGVDRQGLLIDGVIEQFENAYNSSAKFTSTMPRFTVGYQASDDVNFYALRAKGNKPGGFNIGVQDARYTEESRQKQLDEGYGTYKEENAWTTELGMKSMWFDNRLRLNVGVFNIDWENQQVSSSNVMQYKSGLYLANSVIKNIGESRIRGVEVEGEYLMSSAWLMNYAYTYLDAKVLNYVDPDFINSIGTVNAKGRSFRQVPKHKGTLGLSYQGTLANGWGLFGNADISRESLRYGISTEDFWVGPTTTLNFRVGVEPVENLRVIAYVNNALNDRTPNDMLRYIDPTAPRVAYPDLVEGSGYLVNSPRDAVLAARQPRMFGVRLDYKF